MALVLADRVRDTTTTTGTGTVTLSGTAPTGYQTFGTAIGNGNTTYYTINAGSEWEVGIGTYSSTGPTLSRDTVLASSAGGTTKVTFSAGTKNVFVTYPAEESVYQDGSAIKAGSAILGVANGGTGASSLTSGYLVKGNGTSAVSASVVYDDGTNVGIGTASPTSLLDVFSATAATFNVRGNSTTTINAVRSSTDATGPNMVMRKARGTSAAQTAVASGDNMGTLFFSAYGGANNRNIASIAGTVDTYYSDTSIGSYLTFSTTPNGSVTIAERMRIDNAGNVGIGTTSPAFKLSVDNGIQNITRYSAQGALLLRAAAGTQASPTQITAGSSLLGNVVGQGYDGSAYQSTAEVRFYSDATVGSASSPGFMTFLTTASGSTSTTERMRIDSSGNVGVATSTPQTRFEVYGGLIAGSENRQTHPNANAAGGFKAQWNYTGGSAETDLYNLYNGASESFRFYQTTGSGTAQILYSMLPTAHLFYTGGSERMRIDSSGNLLVGGTTQYGAAKLTITNAGAYMALNTTTVGYSLLRGFDNGTERWSIGQIGFGGADGMAFYTGSANTERMRIDSSGNVGIGTTSPATALDVATGFIQLSSGATARSKLFADASVTYLTSEGARAFTISTNSTERMRIDSSGNVGIGTSSPAAKLHVKVSSDAIENYPTGTWAGRIVNAADAASYNGLVVGNRWAADASTVFEAGSIYGGGYAWASFYKVTGIGTHIWGTGTSGTERMRISSGGYVAIGNSNAAAKLSVTFSGAFTWGSAWDGNTVMFGGNGSGSGAGSGGLGISYDDTNGATLGSVIPGVNWKPMRFYSDNLQFNTNGGTERMRILSTGKVLLGTTSDTDGAPFQIDAAAYGNAVYVTRFTNSSTSTSAFNVSRWLQGASGSAIGYVGTGGSTVGTAFFQNRFVVGTQNNTALCFATNDTFRGMIDGGGQFWWGAQSTIDTVSYAPFQITNALAINTNTTAGTTAVSFFNGQGSGVRVGYIGTSGSSTSYNTSSDQRLKKNIADAVDAGSVIDAIQVRQFDWKINDEHQRYGMIAQELDEVFPEAVAHGPTETDMLAVDYSKLVPMLVKEIQSLRARVAQLEGN